MNNSMSAKEYVSVLLAVENLIAYSFQRKKIENWFKSQLE